MDIKVDIILEGQYLSNIALFLNVSFSELNPFKAALYQIVTQQISSSSTSSTHNRVIYLTIRF